MTHAEWKEHLGNWPDSINIYAAWTEERKQLQAEVAGQIDRVLAIQAGWVEKTDKDFFKIKRLEVEIARLRLEIKDLTH